MLEIRHLQLQRGPQRLVHAWSQCVQAGEVLVLMGASGSGKSSLLHWMVGALAPAFQAQGELWLGGERVDHLPTEHRQIGLLFQDDALFGHLSVGHNLAFGLPATWRGPARRARVEQALVDAGLAGCHDRDPATLSGGERARASLMRALLAEPRALLLDEPFSKLDAELRTQLRRFVFERLAHQGIPTVLVTHDPDDAPPGARVVHMHKLQAAPHAG